MSALAREQDGLKSVGTVDIFEYSTDHQKESLSSTYKYHVENGNETVAMEYKQKNMDRMSIGAIFPIVSYFLYFLYRLKTTINGRSSTRGHEDILAWAFLIVELGIACMSPDSSL